ncbi:MAG: hypothetical protein HXS53_11635, partial [Theionarchaea archaeon]|nr:hypothetical protein [Theionarchaea archaeon]
KAQLEKKHYFVGPYVQSDYGRMFSNRLRKAIAIILFEKSYQDITPLLASIDCFSYLYPIEERFFKGYIMGIFDSDTEAITHIFDYLKSEGIIFHYELYLQDYQTKVITPSFYTGSRKSTFVPVLDNLYEDTSLPNLEFGPFSGMTLSEPEQILISYLELGYCMLSSIMEIEKTKGRFYTYAEWKVAKDRLRSQKIIRPVCDIFPLPTMDCAHFFLFIRSHDLVTTRKIIFNFGKGSRMYRKVFIWTSYKTSEPYGVIYCISHPEFTIRLLRQLDMYDEIEDMKFFVIRKEFSLWRGKSIQLGRYDAVNHTLYYPYADYLGHIQQMMEGETCPH